MSFEYALKQAEDLYIWVSEGYWKCQIIGYLVDKLNFHKDRIINYEPFELKTGCPFIENYIISNNYGFYTCCSNTFTNPGVEYKGDCETTAKEYSVLRKNLSHDIKESIPCMCDGCPDITESFFAINPKISVVNFSAGGVCNLKCIYCISPAKLSGGIWNSDVDINKYIEALKEKDILSDDYRMEIAPGEPALNKNLKQYYYLFDNAYITTVYTNATVYDEDLAIYIKKHKVNLCVSVDAGSRETYKKVRGVDLYDKLHTNLLKYSSLDLGAVQLKYIFVPGQNDFVDDVRGFVQLCCEVNPSEVLINLSSRTK